jgi:hypothetical protein
MVVIIDAPYKVLCGGRARGMLIVNACHILVQKNKKLETLEY